MVWRSPMARSLSTTILMAVVACEATAQQGSFDIVPFGNTTYQSVRAVSGDGTTVVGDANFPSLGTAPYRWRRGAASIERLPIGGSGQGEARGVSYNGQSVLVTGPNNWGACLLSPDYSGWVSQTFANMGFGVVGRGLSGDGQHVLMAGYRQDGSVGNAVWHKATRTTELLPENVLGGYEFEAVAISHDGSRIMGYAGIGTATNHPRAVLYDSTGYHDLGPYSMPPLGDLWHYRMSPDGYQFFATRVHLNDPERGYKRVGFEWIEMDPANSGALATSFDGGRLLCGHHNVPAVQEGIRSVRLWDWLRREYYGEWSNGWLSCYLMAVDISYDGTVVAGHCPTSTNSTRAWVADLPIVLPEKVCLPDINGDGFVNGDDFDFFAEAFETGRDTADLNSDCFVNGDDFDLFAEAFEAGC